MANKIVPQTLNSSGVYDKLITAISSGGTGAESESTAVKNLINGLSSTTPDSNDLIPFQDVSSGGAGKTTFSALASTLQSVRGYAKIQTGSYVGTGTYGADNPCSLTFNMIPKILFVYEENQPICVYRERGASYLLSDWIANIRNYSTSVAIKNYSSSCNVYFFFNQKNISWYIKDVFSGGPYGTASEQWNTLDRNYYWFCFG